MKWIPQVSQVGSEAQLGKGCHHLVIQKLTWIGQQRAVNKRAVKAAHVAFGFVGTV